MEHIRKCWEGYNMFDRLRNLFRKNEVRRETPTSKFREMLSCIDRTFRFIENDHEDTFSNNSFFKIIVYNSEGELVAEGTKRRYVSGMVAQAEYEVNEELLQNNPHKIKLLEEAILLRLDVA